MTIIWNKVFRFMKNDKEQETSAIGTNTEFGKIIGVSFLPAFTGASIDYLTEDNQWRHCYDFHDYWNETSSSAYLNKKPYRYRYYDGFEKNGKYFKIDEDENAIEAPWPFKDKK